MSAPDNSGPPETTPPDAVRKHNERQELDSGVLRTSRPVFPPPRPAETKGDALSSSLQPPHSSAPPVDSAVRARVSHPSDNAVFEPDESYERPIPRSPAPKDANESDAWQRSPSLLGEDGYYEDEEEDEDEPEEDLYSGTTINDRYVVDEIIGEGGMGRVYRAHHKVIGKAVAIKILHRQLARDKGAVGRFVREAQAASSVGNRHIVDVSDFGETENGSTYFVMEYLDGSNLTDLIDERGALDSDLVCKLTLQLSDGLAAAHAQQIVHRDLKPDNVTLVEREGDPHFPIILDFGIAKVNAKAGTTKLTMAGAVFGTPHYMSPEQAAGTAVDERTDIYSLGVMMYEMICGELPFDADNFMGILTQHMFKPPASVRATQAAANCPPSLEAIILKCLSKKPDGRYATMKELAEDIRRMQRGEMPGAVDELMARSGGFSVPADYFKPGSPARLPGHTSDSHASDSHASDGRTGDSHTGDSRNSSQVATGVSRSRVPWTLIAGLVSAVVVGLLFTLLDSSEDVEPAPDPSAERAGAPVGEAQIPPADLHVDVMVASNAPGAVARIENEAYSLPKLFTVEQGRKLTVDISAPGFDDETIELDGTEREVKVTQVANGTDATTARSPGASASASASAQTPRTAPKPPPYRRRGAVKPKPKDGIVDPWGR